MDERIEAIFFALLRSALKGEPLDSHMGEEITDHSIRAMLTLAKKHDIAVLLAHAMEKNGLLPEDANLKAALQKELIMAVYRYERLHYELQSICKALGENQIYHIPLKGSVIRKYYSEPWLRTSCDIDILVHPEDLARAEDVLVKSLNYEKAEIGSHDVSFYSKTKVHLELHFDLNEPTGNSYATLNEVWENTVPSSFGEYTLGMRDDFFYLYHIAHMSKHFLNGGCGVRPFMDLWLLDHIVEGEQEARDALLKKENLLVFADSTRLLSEVWFSCQEHTELTRKMQNYLLSGGVYGNMDNRVLVQQGRSGGKVKYALSRIFLPYERIKYRYPILQKHPWLTPIMQVRRWLRILFCGGVGKSVRQLQTNSNITADEAEETALFLSQIGLSKSI